METQAGYPQGTNIYEQHILPCILAAMKGDELLFVSPSTFFGFYSIGAKNYETVCGALEAAKKRGVKIRLIVDVHDLFTARAAEGLLRFLSDKREIRQFDETHDNPDIYQLTVYDRSGESRFADFRSNETTSLHYLGIQSRPFGNLINEGEHVADEVAVGRVRAFDGLWDRATSVERAVIRYSPFYKAHRYLVFNQVALNIAVGLIGVLVGVTFVLQGQPALNPQTLLIYIAAGLVSGVLANVISSLFTRRIDQ
jgi:hypothetical protein